MSTDRTVWLIRHAKALGAEPGRQDIDRPLSRRGERQCEQMEVWLRDRMRRTTGPSVRVSPARRTRQTAELALAHVPGERCVEPLIWNATAAALTTLVQEYDGDLVLVGHNPGMEQAQFALTGQLMPMPTGGIFELAIGDQGRIRLAACFRPD